MIPLLMHTTAASHDYRLLAAQTLINGGSLSESIDDGLYLSVLCAEDAPFFPTGTGAEAGDTFLRDRLAEFTHQCSLWPHATVDPAFKQPIQSDVPTLLLSGEADPITPPANAEQAAKGLTHSISVVAPGVGHNVLYRGCVPKIVTRFIESGSAAGLDTACVADIQPSPFWLTFSGSQP
jgi:pimeloyl-ACP methyl ester carboxylesterase